MEESFYKKHTSNWFQGKKAKMLRTIKNKGGDVLKKGQEVILDGKRKIMTGYLSCSGGFGVESVRRNKNGKKIYIRGVNWKDVELIDALPNNN